MPIQPEGIITSIKSWQSCHSASISHPTIFDVHPPPYNNISDIIGFIPEYTHRFLGIILRKTFCGHLRPVCFKRFIKLLKHTYGHDILIECTREAVAKPQHSGLVSHRQLRTAMERRPYPILQPPHTSMVLRSPQVGGANTCTFNLEITKWLGWLDSNQQRPH